MQQGFECLVHVDLADGAGFDALHILVLLTQPFDFVLGDLALGGVFRH